MGSLNLLLRLWTASLRGLLWAGVLGGIGGSVLGVGVPETAHAGLFSPLIFEDIQIVAREIIERFPPSEFHYVGLGRSPTPIMAYLETLVGEAGVSNLPYSAGILSEEQSKNTLNDHSWLRDHFSRFLPEGEEWGHKQLLLIDFVVSGSGLASATDLLSEYAREHGRPPPVPLLLTHQIWDEAKAQKFFGERPIQQISIYRRSHLYLALRDAIFDDYSEYQGLMNYRKEQSTPMPTEGRQAYQKMKIWIRREIKTRAHPATRPLTGTSWFKRLLDRVSSCSRSLSP